MSTPERRNGWLLPVWATGWDGDISCQILYDVEFFADWGPWKYGERMSTLSIDLENKKVQHHDDEGKLILEAEFKLVPR